MAELESILVCLFSSLGRTLVDRARKRTENDTLLRYQILPCLVTVDVFNMYSSMGYTRCLWSQYKMYQLQVWIAGRARRRARWSAHPDMTKQYATCLARKLREHAGLNIREPAIYFDIWRSMNNRFQQRILDPRVDIAKAAWDPFKKTEWVLPLMIDLSPWRTKLDEIEREAAKNNNFSDVVFVADFPGLNLENFVNPDLKATITVLEGTVIVEEGGHNVTLGKNEVHTVQSNDTHVVHTVSQVPSCWMYMYTNTTLANNVTLQELLREHRSKQLYLQVNYNHVWDICFRQFRHKPRQLIVKYMLHQTITFEISF